MEGNHCGLGSIIISNATPFNLFHYLLLTLNTYDVFKVALIFPEIMNDTLTSLMVRPNYVQSQMEVGSSRWIYLFVIVRHNRKWTSRPGKWFKRSPTPILCIRSCCTSNEPPQMFLPQLHLSADLVLEEHVRKLSMKLPWKLLEQISIPTLKMMFYPVFFLFLKQTKTKQQDISRG